MIFLRRWYWYEINVHGCCQKNYFQPKQLHLLQLLCLEIKIVNPLNIRLFDRRLVAYMGNKFQVF